MTADSAGIIRLYTDGGCRPNPGPGGWGVVVLVPGMKPRELSGGEPATTNNRMELQAALEGLAAVGPDQPVEIVTDSEYLRKGVTEWLASWRARGWRTASGGEVQNRDLWERLDAAIGLRKVRWRWTKGHAGDRWNERADRLAAAALRAVGGDIETPDGLDPEELTQRLGLMPERAPVVLEWLLRRLAAAGWLEAEDGRDGRPRFRLAVPLPAADPEEVRAAQEAHDPTALPSYDLAAVAAAAYPEFLRGQVAGEAVLFGPDRMGLWSEYFANTNPLYAINNRVGAVACARAAPQPIGRVLELGGGLGSGAAALIAELAAGGRLAEVSHYHFTDIAAPFLRRGQRAVAAAADGRVPISSARLDIDRPFEEQGIEAASCGLVWAVNTVHVAADLEATLRRIHDVLVPGAVAVLAECVRPWPDDSVYPELIFNLLEAFRSPQLEPEWRPRGGFLTPEQWRGACLAAGFESVELLPDVASVREVYPSFIVAAIIARRTA